MELSFANIAFVVLGLVGIKWLARAWLALGQALHEIQDYPGGSVVLLHPFRKLSTFLGAYFPLNEYYASKFLEYNKYGSTCVASVILSGAQPAYWLCDADAIKAISTTERGDAFAKDVADVPTIFGSRNAAATQGAEWKKHRGIVNMAFSDANNTLVWSETLRVANEWFAEVERRLEAGAGTQAGAAVTVDLKETMQRVTLAILSTAAFGLHLSWADLGSSGSPPSSSSSKSTITTATTVSNAKSAFMLAAERLPTRLYLSSSLSSSSWLSLTLPGIPYISAHLHATRRAFGGLRQHMFNVLAHSRREALSGKGFMLQPALLSNLVQANVIEGMMLAGREGEGEGADLGTVNGEWRRGSVSVAEQEEFLEEEGEEAGSGVLRDEEIMSNASTFLQMGYESTMKSLVATLALVSLYPEVQQKIFDEAKRVWPDGVPVPKHAPSYKESISKFEYTQATIQESLRLYPSVPLISKIAKRDTVLTVHRFTTTRSLSPSSSLPSREREHKAIEDVVPIEVIVREGNLVVLDVAGVQRNPMYWGNDANQFRPERFIDTKSYYWPRNAYLAFSSGARSCPGQKYVMAQQTALLAAIISRYEILPPQDLPGRDRQETEHFWLEQLMMMASGACAGAGAEAEGEGGVEEGPSSIMGRLMAWVSPWSPWLLSKEMGGVRLRRRT